MLITYLVYIIDKTINLIYNITFDTNEHIFDTSEHIFDTSEQICYVNNVT